MARQGVFKLIAFFILLSMLGILLTNVPPAATTVIAEKTVQDIQIQKRLLSFDPGSSAQFAFHHGAKAAALIDVHSGRILWHDHGATEMKVASLTKIMTAVVAIEHGHLSDKVTVSKNAQGVEGSSIFLREGDELGLEQLLYGLMLRSGNDAAVAIAEHVGGSVDGFVQLMNEKAKLIGLEHTQFKNPNGLDVSGHYSTADDFARLSAYALRIPEFAQIVKTKVFESSEPGGSGTVKWANKNKMLSMYDGADGVKTGFTLMARRCLVSSATRNGQQLAVVTLNDGADWVDHQRLLDYGFANFPNIVVAEAGKALPEKPGSGNLLKTIYPDWKLKSSISYPLRKSESDSIKWKLDIIPDNSSAYQQGLRAVVYLVVNGEFVESGELIQ